MLHWRTLPDSCSTNATAKDVRAISLSVLAHVGFQQERTGIFEGKVESASAQEAQSFRETLCFVLDNSLLTMVVPARFLRLPFLPFKWRQVGEAIEALRSFMIDLYNKKRLRPVQDCGEPASLMGSMVRASKEASLERGIGSEKSSDYYAAQKRGLTRLATVVTVTPTTTTNNAYILRHIFFQFLMDSCANLCIKFLTMKNFFAEFNSFDFHFFVATFTTKHKIL